MRLGGLVYRLWRRPRTDFGGGPRIVGDGGQGEIAGLVLDPRGQPAEGAQIVARPSAVEAQEVAGGDGRFLLRGLSPGDHELEADADGFAPSDRVHAASGSDVTLRLRWLGGVRGHVRDGRTGAPIVGAAVVASPLRGLSLGRGAVATGYDTGGEYVLSGLPEGPCALTAFADGYAAAAPIKILVPGPGASAPNTVEADLTLWAGARAEGTVLDGATGRPVAGAEVLLEREWTVASDLGIGELRAQSGPDGSFALAGLPGGLHSLRVTAAGYHGRILSGVEAQNGDVVGPLTVRLAPVAPGERPGMRLSGIGAALQVRGTEVVIAQLMPGPGSDAGLAPGDVILRVDGVDVATLGFLGTLQRIRGPEGTSVGLTLRRADGSVRVVWVVRGTVQG